MRIQLRAGPRLIALASLALSAVSCADGQPTAPLPESPDFALASVGSEATPTDVVVMDLKENPCTKGPFSPRCDILENDHAGASASEWQIDISFTPPLQNGKAYIADVGRTVGGVYVNATFGAYMAFHDRLGHLDYHDEPHNSHDLGLPVHDDHDVMISEVVPHDVCPLFFVDEDALNPYEKSGFEVFTRRVITPIVVIECVAEAPDHPNKGKGKLKKQRE